MAALRAEEPRGGRASAGPVADDEELTLSFQRGESNAYAHIYDQYSRTVYNVCWRMLGNRDDAQEATQETFLRVYQALGRFNGRYQLKPWLVRIATNVCLDNLRGRSRRPSSGPSLDDLDLDPPAGGEEDPEQAYLRKLESRRVREILEGMPPAHRAAIVLREYEGLSYRDIGLVLSISETQVKALIHRARKRFRTSWTGGRLSVIWPVWLLQRIRGRSLFADGASPDLASVAPPSLATTSAAVSVGPMQHLAGMVADRVAPVVAAGLMGTTAVVAVPAVAASVPVPVIRPMVTQESDSPNLEPTRLDDKDASGDTDAEGSELADAAGQESDALMEAELTEGSDGLDTGESSTLGTVEDSTAGSYYYIVPEETVNPVSDGSDTTGEEATPTEVPGDGAEGTAEGVADGEGTGTEGEIADGETGTDGEVIDETDTGETGIDGEVIDETDTGETGIDGEVIDEIADGETGTDGEVIDETDTGETGIDGEVIDETAFQDISVEEGEDSESCPPDPELTTDEEPLPELCQEDSPPPSGL